MLSIQETKHYLHNSPVLLFPPFPKQQNICKGGRETISIEMLLSLISCDDSLGAMDDGNYKLFYQELEYESSPIFKCLGLTQKWVRFFEVGLDLGCMLIALAV